MDQIQPHWKIPRKTKDPSPKMEEPSFQKQNFVLQPAPLKTKKVWGQVFPMLAGCHKPILCQPYVVCTLLKLFLVPLAF
jgi:hypothetical protein